MTFTITPHASPVSTQAREKTLEDPGFGRVFTDHMVTMRWSTDRGWHDGKVTARAPLALFDWHHGQLLNFNGLTRSALLVWPILTAAWLFVLAGRPAWGKPADPA